MKARATLLIACAALAASSPARAADHEFQDIVRAISEQFDTKPLHIPLLGLAKAVVAVAHPAGTKQLNVAVFQNLNARKGSGRDLLESVRFAVGKGWAPFLQVRSNRDQNMLAYMAGKGNDVRMLVTTVQQDQVVVVEVKVTPEQMQKWITSPGDESRGWFGHGGRDPHDRNLDN